MATDRPGSIPQRKLDAPLVESEDLEANVLMYGVPRGRPDAPTDPFAGWYGVKLEDSKEGSDLADFVKAHDLEAWVKLRKQEREAVALQLEAARQELGGARVRLEKGDSSAEREVEVLSSTIVELEQIQRRQLDAVVRKQGETQALVSHALEVEDDRAGLVEIVSRNLVIEPTFHPGALEQLVLHNNTLLPLVMAMVTNVAGTGWEIVAVAPEEEGEIEEDVEDEDGVDTEIDEVLAGRSQFFVEPWPGMSWTTIKRKLQYDLEASGSGYLEVVEDNEGVPMLARYVDAKLMRLVRLDGPVLVEKELSRFGKIVKVPISQRERRFVLQVGGGALVPTVHHTPTPGTGLPGLTGPGDAITSAAETSRLFTSQGTRVVYFKEMGASRDLDMWTGVWAQPGERLPLTRRATSMIHFTTIKDPRTPYGLPRWINNLPAVLGSRKAEEFNLTFFDQGGVPPLLITVAGGQMAKATKDALEARFNTRNPSAKHQAIVMEILQGRIDKQNRVEVKVERFGSEKMQDSLFQKYDERTSQLIRSSFRLPPIFQGLSEDLNFASAKASYLVAEAQVFQPERQEMDEIVTLQLMRPMPGGPNYRMASMPLVIDSSEDQLKAIQLAIENSLVGGEEAVAALNKISGLEMEFDQAERDGARERDAAKVSAVRASLNPPTADTADTADGADGTAAGLEKAEMRLDGLVALGLEIAEAMVGGARDRARIAKAFAQVATLNPLELERVRRVVSMALLGGDSSALQELADCSASILARTQQ